MKELFAKYKSVILYIFFGGLTTFVSIGSFWLFARVFHIDVLISNVLSWICAVLFAYITNAKWVFESKAEKKQEKASEITKFVGGRLFTLGIEEVMLFIFVSVLHKDEMIIKTIAQVVVLITNYIISKFFVFNAPKK